MSSAFAKAFRNASSTVALVGCFACAAFAQQDPPSRVARLNFISGAVSMETAGAPDWTPADLNRPFTSGDQLYTDSDARAELHTDVAAIRMGPRSALEFVALNDQAVQLKLTLGDLYIRVHNLEPNQIFEVDTPNVTIMLLRDGLYRFRADSNTGLSFAVTRQGQAQLTGGGQSITLNPANSALTNGFDSISFDLEPAPPPDDFDHWCAQRDMREAHLASARYVPPTLIGYEDLDDNGNWDTASDYGPVWYPRAVPVGWAPYHDGHWAWVEPWGWTWIDQARWGFAPFHYGRWVYVHERWGWCPGPIVVAERRDAVVIRPRYAPALVAWFGGAHWGVSVSVGGGGPSLGWVALGAGEVYTPPYHCSQNYFSRVNVSNTRIVNNVNITNVYKTVYVNKTVYNQHFENVNAPNGVMAMSHASFSSGRPVHEAGVVMSDGDRRRLASAQEAPIAQPPPAPARQAFVQAPNARPVPHPPAQTGRAEMVRGGAGHEMRGEMQKPLPNPAPNQPQLQQQPHPQLPRPAAQLPRPPVAPVPPQPALRSNEQRPHDNPAPAPHADSAVRNYPVPAREDRREPAPKAEMRHDTPPRPPEHHDAAPKREEHKEQHPKPEHPKEEHPKPEKDHGGR